jgi:hypothetical protein
MVREHVRAQFPDWRGDDQQRSAAVQFIVSAFLGTLSWRLDTDSPYTADEIFTICRNLVVEGATSFFRGD